MIESIIYKNMKIEVRGSRLDSAGIIYSVHVNEIEHTPWVTPVGSWQEAKLEGFQLGMKAVDEILDSYLINNIVQ